ncbi:hypothetical protein MKK65_18410 [Methylobacterium sp. J-001]|jgi:hypothetical protein|uniref:hypothetical protein n=1 Tax=unclassified Methylobacterium TaxID=2615210 RepID=UPI000AF06CB4|nr:MULTISPECIES: hypothetical protein [unclassified Methylobacterium]MCJ2118512.1 hypothetical protein [Methylobacterium sp. J-001]
MIVIRLIAAGLAVALSLNAARAMDGYLTGSIARPATAESVQDVAALADARPAAVTLPEQSVTTTNPAPKALPPLKPLPKWDPRVCVGC